MSGVDPKLLEILVCPLCKGKLVYRKEAAEDGWKRMLDWFKANGAA